MADNNKYESMLNDKFNELSLPDMNADWLDMKNILDEAMPVKKKRRRGFWFWFTCSLGLVISTTTLGIYAYIKHPENKKQKPTILTQENKNKSYIARTTNQGGNGNQPRNNQPEKKGYVPVIISAAVNTQHVGSTGINTINKNNNWSQTVVTPIENTTSSKTAGRISGIRTISELVDLFSNNKNTETTDKQALLNTLSGKIPVQKSEEFELSTRQVLINADILISRKPSPLMYIKGNPESLFNQPVQKSKGLVIGASVNYNLPLSRQEMSTVNINGKKNSLVDLLPSLYVQYHFNENWYAETEFQFSSPQYTPFHKLASVYKNTGAEKKEENAVWLNKLYYLNVPVTLHFKVLPGLSVGTGVQYSYLKRSLFTNEIALWENTPNGWEKTSSEKNVKSNTSGQKAKSNNGTGSSVSPTLVDTVAQSLRSSDWRTSVDVNYNWKRFNAGFRYNIGLNNYINTKSGSNVLPVKDRNQAFQLYLRFNVFDKRKSSK